MNEFDRFWGFPYGMRRVPTRRNNEAAPVDLRARAAAAAAERERMVAAERERLAAERAAAARARMAGAEPVNWARPVPGPGSRPVVDPWAGQRGAAAGPWGENTSRAAEPAWPAGRATQAVTPEPAPAAPAGPATASASETALLRQEIERLTALVEEKDRLAREASARASESADEIERAKERLRKEAARELEQHKRDVVLGFIDVLDDLDRAAKAAQGESDAAAVREGVELVRKNFHGKLAQLGVEHAPALGDRFDPARHEAVSMLPINDPAQDGLVVAVAREGYRMGEDVIRPARVVVARAS
jgi:molecular chaperone GrpE